MLLRSEGWSTKPELYTLRKTVCHAVARMSGGNSHVRRKIRRLLVRFGKNPTSSQTAKTVKEELTKRPILSRVLEVLGVALAVAGCAEVFPLAVSLLLYGLALTVLSAGIWEDTKGLKKKHKIWSRAGLFGIYGFVIFFPLQNQYDKEINLRLDFKESPYFSWWRRQVITHDIAKFKKYLTDLRISVPREIPPLGIETGQNSGGFGLLTPPNLPLYRSTLTIGESHVSDRPAATGTYSGYVVERLQFKSFSNVPWPIPKERLPEYMNSLLIGRGFTDYFNSSFWNENRIEFPSLPANLFWKLRANLGAPFADKLAASTLKTMVDEPNEVRDKDIDVYLIRALMIGDSIVDNGCGKWSQISNILVSSGISREQITSQRLTQSAVSSACTEAWSSRVHDSQTKPRPISSH